MYKTMCILAIPSIKKNNITKKIEKKVGMDQSTKKHTNKGNKDGNQGQESSLLLLSSALVVDLPDTSNYL